MTGNGYAVVLRNKSNVENDPTPDAYLLHDGNVEPWEFKRLSERATNLTVNLTDKFIDGTRAHHAAERP